MAARLIFISFCFLLAARDAFSDFDLAKGVHPVFMLLVYTVATTCFAWMFRFATTGSPSIVRPFQQLDRAQQKTFIKLGLATFVVYAITIFGIKKLTSPVFNVIDYGGMPLLTLLMAATMLRDRVLKHQVLGSCVAMIGLVVFFIAPVRSFAPDLVSACWREWVLLALLSPYFTSVCSAYQKEQIDRGMKPPEVLMYRFPIPSIVMLIWFLIERPPFAWSQLPGLLVISLFGVFLPLWLLCLGFARASLARFSVYLFLIPLFTFLLVFIRARFSDSSEIQARAALLRSPEVLIGSLTVLVGYAVFEGTLRIRGRQSGS